MKALLVCPAIRPAVSQLAEVQPLAALPILGESLVNHWLEHVAALGAREVTILAADRAEQVREVVGDGRRWGIQVEVVPATVEPSRAEATARHRADGEPGWLPAPHDVTVMNHLPGCPESPLFESYGAWFSAGSAWMPRALTPARVRVSEILPGVWAGRRARISPRAHLLAPCWIGDQVYVGPRAVVGRGAIVEDRAVIEVGARVLQSYVGPDTFVGRMASVTDSLALGSTLINWRTESILRVPDPFLLCSLARPSSGGSGGVLASVAGALGRFLAVPFNVLTASWSRPVRPSGLKLPN